MPSKAEAAVQRLSVKRSFDKLGRRPTDFELRVYEAATAIPRGKVTTYGELARVLKSSSRAVGQALRRNPFAPEVPCHRIVKTSLDIGGFSGTQGDTELVRKKKRLLEDEGVRFDSRNVASRAFVVNSDDLQSLLTFDNTPSFVVHEQ